MVAHPEERRIAALLRELIVRSGTPPETVERELGWEPGRLAALLDGRLRLGFEEVLDVLPLVGTTPIDFFTGLYERPAPLSAEDPARLRARGRLFERSLRAVRKALAGRAAWKREGAEAGED